MKWVKRTNATRWERLPTRTYYTATKGGEQYSVRPVWQFGGLTKDTWDWWAFCPGGDNTPCESLDAAKARCEHVAQQRAAWRKDAPRREREAAEKAAAEERQRFDALVARVCKMLDVVDYAYVARIVAATETALQEREGGT